MSRLEQAPLFEPLPPGERRMLVEWAPVAKENLGRMRDRRGGEKASRQRPSLESPLSQMTLPGALPEAAWQRLARAPRSAVDREAWPVVPWEQREQQWRKHATTDGFRRRLDAALSVARRAAEKGRFYAALSGGKDSAAMAGVLREAGVPLEGVYAASAFDYPGALEAVDALGKAVGMPVTVLHPAELDRHVDRICARYGRVRPRRRPGVREYDEWDLLRCFPPGVCVLDEGPMKLLVDATGHANLLTAHQYAEGFDGCHTGVRRLESLARHFNWRAKGALYKSKVDGRWTSTPLVTWSGKDVWAFLTTRKLPVLTYYRLAYETGLAADDPAKIRTGSALVYADVARRGVLRPVPKVYPEFWARLVRARPELADFARALGGRPTK